MTKELPWLLGILSVFLEFPYYNPEADLGGITAS
jgi:hypothetical protein